MRSTNFAIVSVNKVGVLSARLVCYLNQLSRRPVVANSKEGLGKAKIYAAATAAGRYGAPARFPQHRSHCTADCVGLFGRGFQDLDDRIWGRVFNL